MQRLTKLHLFLADKTEWDDTTWFKVERYLRDNMSVPGMLMLVSLAGAELADAAASFKMDTMKVLHGIQPREVLREWDRRRERQ